MSFKRFPWMACMACAALLAAGVGFAEEQDADPAELPDRVENFRLTDHTGRSHELYRHVDAPAVVLYVHGNACPIVRQSIPKLRGIRDEFTPEGVVFLMINANPQDTRDEVLEEAGEFEIDFPVLMDESQMIVRGLGTRRTAEVLVLIPGDDWRIAYRGNVDDRFDYGTRRNEAEHEWLRDALRAVLAGESVETARTETKGCLINFLEREQISYARDVAPIIAERCATCHVQGGIGPFALNNHHRVRGWGAMIEEVVRTQRMPPWGGDNARTRFENDIALTPEEERILLSWLNAGAPKEADEPDPLTDIQPAAAEWAMGEPDLVVEIPHVEDIPADGVVDYRYIHVPSGLTENKWVSAVEVRPTNPSVLHHALIFVVYPRAYRHIQPNPRQGLNGYFAAYLPGSKIQPYPEGMGQFLPAGATFVFQMHYNPTGRPERDQTRMALYFHDEPPAKALMIQAASTTNLRIPPNHPDFEVDASHRFDNDVTLLGVSPHMHYRGSRMAFTAEYPEGEEVFLASVPFFQFDWQPMYRFAEYKELPAGARVRSRGAFDNSRHNPYNPNPDQWVYFGEQSFQEMFIGYVKFAMDRDDDHFKPAEYSTEGLIGYGTPLTEENIVGTRWRLTRQLILEFKEDNLAIASNVIRGRWETQDNVIHLVGGGREYRLTMQGDELFFHGRPLRRLR